MAGPQGFKQRLQPRSGQAKINRFNTQRSGIDDHPRHLHNYQHTRFSPAGNQYDRRDFNVIDSRTNLGMRYKGGSDREEELKSSYFSNAYHTNPDTNQKFGHSMSNFQGPNREWGESRYIFPDASGFGQRWDDKGNMSEYPIQLKGPQTWNYDPGSWTGFNGGGYAQSETKTRQNNRFNDAKSNYILGSRTPGHAIYEQNRWEEAGGRGPFPVMKKGTDFRPTMDAQGRIFELYNSKGQVDPYPMKMRSMTTPGWMEARITNPGNSGIMGLEMADASDYMNKIKEGYQKVDPYVDWQDKSIGHEWNIPLWGGNLGIGGEYDIDDNEYNVGINWII